MAVKTVSFHLTGMSREDKKLLADLCAWLGRAGSAMAREWLRAWSEVTDGRFDWSAIQKRGVEAGKARFAETGFRPELINDLQRTEFWARFRAELRKVRKGEPASLPIPGSAPFILLRLDPGNAQAQIEQDGEGTWWLRDPRFYPGGAGNPDNHRRWRLKPMGRGKRAAWAPRLLARATKLGCVRIMRDREREGWVARISLHVPEEARREIVGEPVWAGIDLGLHHPAVLSIPDREEGGIVRFFGREQWRAMWERLDRYEARKKALNDAGKRRAARELRAKITGVRQHVNELISREIVDLCRGLGVHGIRMEDLRGLGTRGKGKIKFWSRYHLRTRIEQKAREAGLEFELVEPAETSQTCSACGHRHEDNRKGAEFRCLKCGFARHADVNAANNIARAMARFEPPAGAAAAHEPRRLEIAEWGQWTGEAPVLRRGGMRRWR